MASSGNSTYFRKGFGLRAEVQRSLESDYTGRLVDLMREREYTLSAGDLTLRLAREFGFCYGVDRAVEYAYQTRSKFPDRRIFLVGEIIHNPHVNEKLRSMGITILLPVGMTGRRADGQTGGWTVSAAASLGPGNEPEGRSEEVQSRTNGEDAAAHPPSQSGHRSDAAAELQHRFDFSSITPKDVVILPAFGVTMQDFAALREIGCVVVDTTCGSVLSVWKRVDSYAKDGFTALIHGKYYHEETRATASQTSKYEGGRYLIVRDMAEARLVCDYMEGRGDRAAFLARFAHAASEGFDPDRDLLRIGVANQTTMLASESLAIAEEIGRSMERARGIQYRAEAFRSFDTICSATQDRQDAVKALLVEPLDLMLVIGGYNSSNTISLAAMCAQRVVTYHVEDPAGIDVERGALRHMPIGVHEEQEVIGWLSALGPVRVGVTAGASTPNNKIGEAIARIFATRGIDPGSIE